MSIRITDLPVATTLTGNELVPLVQGGVTKSAGTSLLSNLASVATGPISISGGVTSITSQTGTGTTFAMAQSPTLVTPVLGTATASTINKITFTQPATGATVTIADNKTFTSSNTLTLAGTDGSTLTIGTGGTLGTAAYTDSSAYLTTATTINVGTTNFALNRASAPQSLTGVNIDGSAGTAGTAAALSATLVPASGGTGISNNNAATVTSSGNFAYTRTLTAPTNVTFPASGTLINSTDTAAKATILATTRAIYGNNFDGSAPLSGIIASTYGGTGNGFAKFSGPTSTEKTFTLPDATATLLYSGGALGTPSSGVLTSCTGTAAGLTAGNVTTNANLTGDVTSSGNTTTVPDATYNTILLKDYVGTPGGTADAIALSPTTAIASYASAVGQRWLFTASGNNTVSPPTINVSGKGALNTTMGSVATPVGGLISGNLYWALLETASSIRLSPYDSVSSNGDTVNGTLTILPTNSLILGTGSSATGQITLKNSSNTNNVILQAGATGASITHTWPATAPTTGQVLASTSGGVMSWTTVAPAGQLPVLEAFRDFGGL